MEILAAGGFANELALTIVGGVAAGLILQLFTSRRGGSLQGQTTVAPAERRGGSFFGEFLRLVLAVGGGVLITLVFARPLIQAGIAPKGAITRLALVMGSATVIWLLLYAARRR